MVESNSTLPLAGTELVRKGLFDRLSKDAFAGINLVLNSANFDMLQPGEVHILWNHVNIDQEAIANMAVSGFVDQVDYFVYVSHWQYEKYRYRFNAPQHNSIVIKNAIDPIGYVDKPRKIKLIYTSMPWRGLAVLLDAFELLNRNDIELDIFSSTIIYGSDFHSHAENHFSPLFERAKKMPNVNYYGYASNEDVRQALMDSHIFAYPSIWEETSCVSAIEAGAAGLSMVTTNLGALYETLAEWPMYVHFDSNWNNLVRNFAAALNQAIDDYWLSSTQIKLYEQHQYFNKFWTWPTRIKEWENFLNGVRREKNLAP